MKVVKTPRIWLEGDLDGIDEGVVSFGVSLEFEDEVGVLVDSLLSGLVESCLVDMEDVIRLLPGDDGVLIEGLLPALRVRICREIMKKLIDLSDVDMGKMAGFLMEFSGGER